MFLQESFKMLISNARKNKNYEGCKTPIHPDVKYCITGCKNN
jgi:hypothetical protein